MPEVPAVLKSVLSEKLADSLAGDIPPSTPRQVEGVPFFPGKATVVVGMRRVGKTTYLNQLRRERLESGVARHCLPYLNFEDERLEGLQAAHLGWLLDELDRNLVGQAHGRVLWSFDEIQLVDGWEKFLRRLLDRGDVDVVATGSSATLLSREIATSLRGRAWTKSLFPFGFSEFLHHRGWNAPKPGKAVAAKDAAPMERRFLQWLTDGGFPEAQGLDAATRGQLLLDYVDVAMLRDVVERHAVANVAGLRSMVRQLLGNAGAFFSVEKMHAALKSQGFNISRDTMHQMLGHLEDCFLVRLVGMESSSARQRMVNPRKAYPADTGLIPLFDRSGKANVGHALEGAVLLELERRRCVVTYVKTRSGFEVDFLAKHPDGTSDLIQVCADASAPETAQRELRALEEAASQFPTTRRLLLVMDRSGFPRASPPGIEVRSAWEWMLEAKVGRGRI
ncbi:MAG TPA: ATP-binding protein [Fibrobacteria bacterium]|nr:ATP-binding protein [Fibrobacteria bacterium]HOX51115.1 ATP-binding protein [Fibrobacteria bacterium]